MKGRRKKPPKKEAFKIGRNECGEKKLI